MPPTASGSGSSRGDGTAGVADPFAVVSCAIGTRMGSPFALIPPVTGTSGGTGALAAAVLGAGEVRFPPCRDHQVLPAAGPDPEAGARMSSARTGTGRDVRDPPAPPGCRPA